MSLFKTCAWAICLAGALSAPGAMGGENPQAAEREAMAVKLSQKGAEAARRKNHERALALHEMAVKYRIAMDDSAGAVLEIHNLAVDLFRLNRLEEAEGKLASALELYDDEKKLGMGRDGDKPMRSAMARAALLKAIILVGKADFKGAGQWAGQAMEHCSRGDCGFKGRIFNLQARAAVLAGDRKKALAAAQNALEAGRKEGDGVETANAIRIIAQAAEEEKDAKKAYLEYKNALALDRELKMGPKITLDLLGLARVSAMMGAAERARIFAKKALAVARAADYPAGEKAAESLAAELAGR